MARKNKGSAKLAWLLAIALIGYAYMTCWASPSTPKTTPVVISIDTLTYHKESYHKRFFFLRDAKATNPMFIWGRCIFQATDGQYSVLAISTHPYAEGDPVEGIFYFEILFSIEQGYLILMREVPN